jgi:hypothetical protein
MNSTEKLPSAPVPHKARMPIVLLTLVSMVAVLSDIFRGSNGPFTWFGLAGAAASLLAAELLLAKKT